MIRFVDHVGRKYKTYRQAKRSGRHEGPGWEPTAVTIKESQIALAIARAEEDRERFFTRYAVIEGPTNRPVTTRLWTRAADAVRVARRHPDRRVVRVVLSIAAD